MFPPLTCSFNELVDHPTRFQEFNLKMDLYDKKLIEKLLKLLSILSCHEMNQKEYLLLKGIHQSLLEDKTQLIKDNQWKGR